MLRLVFFAFLIGCLAAKDYDCFFDKKEKVKEDVRAVSMSCNVQKDGDMTFKVNAEIDQKVQIDNDWKIEVVVNHAEEEGGEYKELKIFKNMGVCDFMKTCYKSFFYDTIKNYSNAPHYDTCPLPPAKYIVKDYPFDAKVFKFLMKPGYYKVVVTMVDNTDQQRLVHEYYAHIVEK